MTLYRISYFLTKLGLSEVARAGRRTYGAINWRGKKIEKVLKLSTVEKGEREIQKIKKIKLKLFVKLKSQLKKAQQTEYEEEVERVHSLLGHTNVELVEYKEKFTKLEQAQIKAD